MAAQPDDYAIVVGIQHYPEYRALQGSAADAKAFAHWLSKDPFGGGLPEDNCKLIVSGPDPPPVPVKAQVDDAVGEIMKASAKGARRFYFYFSGHGMSDDDLDLALCLANWSSSRRSAAMSYTGYFKFFIKLGNFKEVVFLLDCCRVREISVHGADPEHNVVKTSKAAGGVSTLTAFAAEAGDPAYEAKLAELEAQGRHSTAYGHFTEALLEALRGGAAGPQNGVTSQRLEEYVKKRTAEIAEKHEHRQDARVIPNIKYGVNMIFGDYPAASEVVIEFEPPRAAPVTLFGPRAEEIKSGLADTGPWHLQLTAGKYCLNEAGSDKFFRVRGGTEVAHERF